MKKLNVLFDFNIILSGYFDESFKTGIFWTQYNIIKEVIKKYDNEINFFAYCYCSEGFYNNKLLKKYPEFKNIKFKNIYSRGEQCGMVLKTYIRNLRKDKKQSGNIFTKIKNNTKILLLKFIKLSTKLIPGGAPNLENIDIYQSFYLKIPVAIKNSKNIKKFTIIHDIIPVTHSEYVSDGSEGFMKIINSIDDDTTIFTDSEFSKKEIIKNFKNFKKNKIIANKLAANGNTYFKLKDYKKYNSVLEKYGISINSKYFLSLSSLNKRKNLAFLIEGFVKFLDKNPKIKDINLVLAGPKGWLMEEMFDSIKNANKYRDKIIVTGFVDEKDINVIYNGAFAFIFPSLAEGFGLPVLEALQCGIPVISSNATSLPEVYGDAALEIDPHKTKDLISAMELMYSDKKTRDRLAKNGIKQSQKFSWEKTVDNMVKEYLS